MDRIKNDITNPEFWRRAGIRALKTFCQTAEFRPVEEDESTGE